MLSITIENLVGSLVLQLLINEGGNKDALHFHFDLHMGSYENAREYTQRRGLHLIYYLPPDHAAVSVFSAVQYSPFERYQKVSEWKHETTHDCCWRNTNIFANVYFDMAKEINALRVVDGLKEVAPITMSEHNSFSGQLGNHALWNWIPVEITKDPNDNSNYKRILKVK